MDQTNTKRNFTNRNNLEYIEQLYQQYKVQPDSVSADWKMFFDGVEFASEGGMGLSDSELDVYNLIQAYRNFGHLEAQLDPLMNQAAPSNELALNRFNLKESDLEKTFAIGSICGKPNATLKDIIAHLKSVYCGRLSVQCGEALPDIRNFFIKEFETNLPKYSAEEKKAIHKTLTKTEALEKFIHTRFVGAKRFSVEGGDGAMPMYDILASRAASMGVKNLVVGMAHRGRLNALVNFFGKPVEQLFSEFSGTFETEEPIADFDGDVKYHMGYRSTLSTPGGKIDVELAFNPSHLEAVNPVVLGQARAIQRLHKDTSNRKTVVPVLVHGDAAFAGQGIVLEILQMSQVRGYRVGGTIHLIIDNQIGFTTNPENSRSATYSSDTAKVLAAPVLHVNGDDAEACCRAMEIALKFRQTFAQDIVIDMLCYRRFGHNEGDEPAYTQPQMYEIIKKHPTLREIYGKKLVSEGLITQAQLDSDLNTQMDAFQNTLDSVKKKAPKLAVNKFDGLWKGLRRATQADFDKTWDTSFDLKKLKEIGNALSTYPKTFNPHPKLLKLLETRQKMAEGTDGVDWGMGELLAYGSLISEGHSVRFTGQDACRGTFTHRHAVLYDHKTGEAHNALKAMAGDKKDFCVYDSILSEFGVLGFEYGNSITDPSFLTIWEAQFGDFANGAQIIIDQFIAAGETKWQQMSGLVMLLPHGMEGQGPEHSSARPERFLQMAAQNNMQIMNLTTPGQIFHAMRRQMHRPFRKPMIVMSPKILLRHPKATSNIEEMAKGSFQEVIDDTLADKKKVENIILCSGKVYYELVEEREKQKNKDKYAIIRVEQLYPFPAKQLAKILSSYPKAKRIIWTQEEPQNMGYWQFVYFKMADMVKAEKMALEIEYAGRNERSSPAVGSQYTHKHEQHDLLEMAFRF